MQWASKWGQRIKKEKKEVKLLHGKPSPIPHLFCSFYWNIEKLRRGTKGIGATKKKTYIHSQLHTSKISHPKSNELYNTGWIWSHESRGHNLRLVQPLGRLVCNCSQRCKNIKHKMEIETSDPVYFSHLGLSIAQENLALRIVPLQ